MKLVLFNFKNYLGVSDSVKVASAISRFKTKHQLVVAPSTASFYALSKKLKGKRLKLCAQDFDPIESRGAHTGDIFIQDLKEIGCSHALIGHSELRRRQGPMADEGEELISAKIRLCIEHGIIPVLCFGETGSSRDAGSAGRIIESQLRSALRQLQRSRKQVILVYEPQWTISSTKDARGASIADIERVRSIVKKTVGSRIRYAFLYGGSVNGDNLQYYISSRAVDGVLIGRAGTETSSLKKIAKSL